MKTVEQINKTIKDLTAKIEVMLDYTPILYSLASHQADIALNVENLCALETWRDQVKDGMNESDLKANVGVYPGRNNWALRVILGCINKENKMSKFAWGSSQYDSIADMFRRASKHGFDEAIKLLESEDISVDCEPNIEMMNCFCLGQCGNMMVAWKNSSKDLWYALDMMSDIVFKYGFSMTYNNEVIPNDDPLRLSLIALFLVENKLATEDDFKGYDT